MNDQNNRWELGALYTGVEDTSLQKDMQSVLQDAQAFRTAYHGQINTPALNAERLSTVLQQYEDLQLKLIKPYLFAQLLFSSDSRNPAYTRLLSQARDVWQTIHEQTLFVELEILKLDQKQFADLLKHPEVAGYGHYLTTLRAHAPYMLHEEVEQALKRKDLSGKEAFVQLFDELTSGLSYRFCFPGEDEEREASGEELLALIYHPNRDVREAAFATFLDKHAEHALTLTSCFNNIFLDHAKESELRGYPELMTPTHLSSETDPEMVEKMLAVTEEHYPLAQEYFELKREMLGYDTLKNTDLYAPVVSDVRKFDYAEAVDLVMNAFKEFSPVLGEILTRLCETGRIDAFPRAGKTGGAFCMGLYPGSDPYVLLNFTGTLRDVSTLAHELGHAAHYALSGEQKYCHYHAPLPLAETASVFAEMLLTRSLLEREPDPQTKMALLCAKIEEIIATTFRQTVLTRFEEAAHKRRGEALLSSSDFCELWLQENARLLGNVEMIPAYRWGWLYIGHFIHARFYCFSYVFGELLVLALYQRYRQEGAASFVPAYLDLLRAGGSASPQELVRNMGIELHDETFWAQGYGLLKELIEELKRVRASAQK